MNSSDPITIIKPSSKISFPDFAEVWRYRELLWTFVMRDLKVRYRQTVVGGLWAIIQPLITMGIFSFFFGYLAKIPGDGVPYPVFSYSGLVLWVYFSSTLSGSSGSIVGSASLYTKVYFPRIIAPMSAGLTGMVDYTIALVILFLLMFIYHVPVSPFIIFLPILLILTWILATGIGLWIGSINVKYRDVAYITPFFLQLFMYITPVIYPVSIAPNFKNLLMLNPMTGIITTHRAIILGGADLPVTGLLISILVSITIFITGSIYFRSVERKFADIV